MRLFRSLASRILMAVVRRAPPGGDEWLSAMSREMDFVESDWEALLWAIGGVKLVTLSRKGEDTMHGYRINRFSAGLLITLSLTALITVVTGYFQPPQADEGAAAHIFQLSILALIPSLLLFLSTVDWKQPVRSMRLLAYPASALVLAFGALYYLEHYR